MKDQRRPSRRQRDILAFIRDFQQKRGFPPSIREIGEGVGLSSSSTVHSHLQQLSRKGYVQLNKSKPRSIELTDRPTELPVLAQLQAECKRLRDGAQLALANPHVWREALEEALNPMPPEAMVPLPEREVA